MTGFTSTHTLYGKERKIRTGETPGTYHHDYSEDSSKWSSACKESIFNYGEWIGVLAEHKRLEAEAKKIAGKFVASNGIVVAPQLKGDPAVNFSRIPSLRPSQTVPLNVLDAYQEYLARPLEEEEPLADWERALLGLPPVNLPRPEVGENIWMEVLYGGKTPKVYVGTVRGWCKNPNNQEYVELDNGESSWWPGTVPDGETYTVVTAWGLVEPESITLEHREGEYVHLVSPTGAFNWTITCDGEKWYQDELDCYPYSPADAQRYAGGLGGYHVVSHGFLEGTTKKIEMPKVGQYIAVTHRDGRTSTGYLTEPMLPGRYMGVELDGRWVGYMPTHPEPEWRESYDNDVISWVEAPEPRKIKWPKGATVQFKYGRKQAVYEVREDVYEGDTHFIPDHRPNDERRRIVDDYQRVEIKVVD